jgi:hypothetical protein
MNHGVHACFHVRYWQSTEAVRFIHALVIWHKMFNADGKFANIVVWQREPLCTAVSRFVNSLKGFAHSAKIKPDLAAFCETSCTQKHRL